MTLERLRQIMDAETEDFQRHIFKYKEDTYNGVIYYGDPDGIGIFIWLYKDDYYDGIHADYKDCELVE